VCEEERVAGCVAVGVAVETSCIALVLVCNVIHGEKVRERAKTRARARARASL